MSIESTAHQLREGLGLDDDQADSLYEALVERSIDVAIEWGATFEEAVQRYGTPGRHYTDPRELPF